MHSFAWHATADVLVALADGRLVIWYFPAAALDNRFALERTQEHRTLPNLDMATVDACSDGVVCIRQRNGVLQHAFIAAFAVELHALMSAKRCSAVRDGQPSAVGVCGRAKGRGARRAAARASMLNMASSPIDSALALRCCAPIPLLAVFDFGIRPALTFLCRWDASLRLCRFARDPMLWACLAACAVKHGQLQAAEHAFGATSEARCEPRRPQLALRPPGPPWRTASCSGQEEAVAIAVNAPSLNGGAA